MYGLPSGRAFVAAYDDGFRGYGAYRSLADKTCEMKRLLVPRCFQGAGLGRRLCSALIAAAREDGFRLTRLDSRLRGNDEVQGPAVAHFSKCQ